MEPHSQVITHKPPQALRGDALREALEPLGFDDALVVSGDFPCAEPLPTPFVEVDLGAPPSSDEPRALTGDELARVLEALRTTRDP